MPGEQKKIPAMFYRASDGSEPARDWLLALDSADRKIIGVDIATVEFGWPIGMPTCRALGQGLWEVRSNLPSNRISRVLFCIVDNRLVLLHGFIKKTQKTPDQDMALARARLKDVQR